MDRLLPLGEHRWLELLGVQGAILGHFLRIFLPVFFDRELDDAKLVLAFLLPIIDFTGDVDLRLESHGYCHTLFIALFVPEEISWVVLHLASNLLMNILVCPI